MSGADKAVCYICGKELMNIKCCNRHIKRIHNVHTNGEPAEPAEKVTCVTCGKQYSQKSSLQRHNDAVHNVNSNKSLSKLKCDQCDYETIFKSNLRRHLMKTHQNKNPKRLRKFICSMCPSNFSNLRSLKYHEKTKHMLGTKKYPKRKCPLCDYVSYEIRKSVIYKHFETKHNIVMNWQTHTFNSQEDFKLWKRSVEQENAVYYMAKFRSEKDLYYTCNRSGNFVSKSSNIRKLKSSGSCKINGFCPSAMFVNQESDSVVVKYLPVHVGHEKDPMYLRISLGGLGCGRKYKRAMREKREREKSKIKETHVEENAFIVAVIGDNDIISNEVVIEENEVVIEENKVVIEEGIVQEINGEADIDNVASEPDSYTEDHDTTLYLKKVKLFQEFREFEGFLQKNLTSIEQIEYVRREIVKIVTDINVSNSAVNIK